MTPRQQRARLDRLERLARKQVTDAFALLEKNLDFPSVEIEIHDNDQEVLRDISNEAKDRMSDARLEHVLKLLDNRGRAYVRLVTDIETQKALRVIMNDVTRAAWFDFSAIPIEAIPPTHPFAPRHEKSQIQRDELLKRTQHWVIEGLRRLDSLHKTHVSGKSEIDRPAYRDEIKAWMQRVGMESQKQAAKRLAVSIDVLKSIMSGKGKKRFSEETLLSVLKKIGAATDSD